MKHSTQQNFAVHTVWREMNALEAAAATDWESACCQMFSLYSAAGEQYMHDVCHSIDLWIFENKLTPRLASHLHQLISKEDNASLKRHYEMWLAYQVS